MAQENTPSEWQLSHEEIAGGIIQTPDGDYEISRLIGPRIDRRKVQADLHLMASAPRLLRTARLAEAVCSQLLTRIADAPDAQSFRELTTALADIRRAISEAEGRLRQATPTYGSPSSPTREDQL